MDILIIDDEENSQEFLNIILEQYCEGIGEIHLADNVDTALEIINKIHPDLVFLDIEMPEKSGFDLLDCIKEAEFLTCFVTGYEKYAVKAIKYGAFGYILKPINIPELKEVIFKARVSLEDELNGKSSLIIKSRKKLDVIKFDQLLYMKAEGNYTAVFLKSNKKLLSSKKLGELESYLPEPRFFRIHKSYLVNISSISSIQLSRTGELELENGVILPVASRKLSTLKRILS